MRTSTQVLVVLNFSVLMLLVMVNFSVLWQQQGNAVSHGLSPVARGLSARDPSSATAAKSTYRQLALSTIAGSSTQKTDCPDGLQFRTDRLRSTDKDKDFDGQSSSTDRRRIPRIIHQTSKSRCLATSIFNLTEQWNFDGYSYHLHDDQAIERLFNQEAANFPLLPLVSRHCLISGTARADLWRYVILFVYGGLYVDLDSAPHAFQPETSIGQNDDALFVVEQFHLLSQYFMAVAPRHPLMWYSVNRALQNIWDLADTGRFSAAMVTGPHALHQAYIDFRADVGEHVDQAEPGRKPVFAGKFVGSKNYTVTVIGRGEDQNEYVHRDLLGARRKQAAYKRMYMRHFQQDKRFATGRSCLSAVLYES